MCIAAPDEGEDARDPAHRVGHDRPLRAAGDRPSDLGYIHLVIIAIISLIITMLLLLLLLILILIIIIIQESIFW